MSETTDETTADTVTIRGDEWPAASVFVRGEHGDLWAVAPADVAPDTACPVGDVGLWTDGGLFERATGVSVADCADTLRCHRYAVSLHHDSVEQMEPVAHTDVTIADLNALVDTCTTGDERAATLLDGAQDVLLGDDTHGDAVANQEHIAAGWTWYLRGAGLLDEDAEITGGDVGRMMGLLKMSRTAVGTYDVDHDRDVAGYAGIAAACAVERGTVDEDELHVDDAGAHE